MMTHLTDLYEAILRGDTEGAEEAAYSALAANTHAQQLLTAGVIPSVHEACRRFQAHEYFVPELLIVCRAMKKALKVIRPRAAADGVRPLSRVFVISLAYQADEMTGRLAADILEGAGFEVSRSSLGAIEQEGAQIWQVGTIPVVVLVVPTIAFCREWVSWQAVVRDTVEKLRSACAKHSTKIVVLGSCWNCVDEFHVDACLEDIGDVVAAVEPLTRPVGPA